MLTITFARELEVATSLCGLPLSDAAKERVTGILAHGPFDWDLFFKVAALWQLEPVLFSNLRNQFSAAIPSAVLDSLFREERQARATALTGTLLTADVIAAFERSGLPVVLLKGPAVGIVGYDDPSMRQAADVDILVRRADIPDATGLLEKIGYAPDFPPSEQAELVRQQHALEFTGARAKVELHWALLSRHLRLDFNADELWAATRSVPCAGRPITILSNHHLFLFLCAHGAKHEWMRPRWICDIAMLGPKLDDTDVANVVELAARTHSRHLLALGLRLAQSIFNADLTKFPENAFAPEWDATDLIELVRTRMIPGGDAYLPPPGFLQRLGPRVGPLLFWTAARERWRDRLGTIANVVFVPTSSDRGPEPLKWIARPMRIAGQAVGRATRR